MKLRNNYKIYREIVLNFFNNQCQSCKNNHPKLAIHHIDYDTSNNEISNLRMLCPKCHGDLHSRLVLREINKEQKQRDNLKESDSPDTQEEENKNE